MARQKSLKLDVALQLLRRSGTRLVLTHTESGPEYRVDPGGGRVTEKTAKRILSFRACRPLDAGLLPETAQSWTLSV
jgi:hypothetical protein